MGMKISFLLLKKIKTFYKMINMKGKRTGIDFSEHELIITKNDNVLIHHLKKPNTVMDNVKFINVEGVLLVTGDYSRWSFCREFHPSAEGRVSDYYWCEKLSIGSSQTYSDYSPDKTHETLVEELDNYIKDKTEENPKFDEENEDDDILNYYKNCISNTDDELDYTYCAYRNLPKGIDGESVTFMKKIKPQLQVVFDAFEEICRRMKEEENKNPKTIKNEQIN